VFAAAVLALTGCSSDNPSDDPSGVDRGQEFNAADVAFAQDMIPHHEQAVEMAEMAASHTGNPAVQGLATEISAAQGPEVELMTQWLEAWGQTPTQTSSGHDMGDMDMGDMPGMMDTDQMNQLTAASNADWDTLFLTLMIEHHEGALDMARTEIANGQNPDAIALAEKIEAAQRAEIARMRQMLNS
jgi:uncharacterized protein (DUF305 family)